MTVLAYVCHMPSDNIMCWISTLVLKFFIVFVGDTGTHCKSKHIQNGAKALDMNRQLLGIITYKGLT